MEISIDSQKYLSFASRHSHFLKFFARWGYASRALVYFIVGFFAFIAAFGGGPIVSPKGALASLLNEPFGQTLLWVVTFGLLGYSLWRFVQSSLDTDNHGNDLKGISVRAGLLVSSISHLSLAYWTGYLALNSRSESSSSSGEWVAWLMSLPGGKVYVFLLASAILGAGVAQFIKGYKKGFVKYCKKVESNDFLTRICQVGLYARGIAFALISYLFYQVVISNAGTDGKGLANALALVQEQSMGWLFLATMGVGLICFGFYSAVQSYCREISVS